MGETSVYQEDITPEALIEWCELSGERVGILIDVREDLEWQYYHLDEAKHIPMQTIPARMQELPQEEPIYVLCAHGVRSAAVCEYLKRQGFENTVNVLGGISAVSRLKGFRYD
jgi:rhodanese-related sulfurtransferase